MPDEVRHRRREPGGPWVALTAVVFYPITLLVARRRMIGLEHVPARGPAMLVCNHVSYLDPVYTAVFVHRARRTPRFLAKDSLWAVPVLGRIMGGSRQIPVSRGSRDAGTSIEAARRAFADDGVVVIYPEGTITRDPEGWPMAARSGAARLALASDVPVIPTVHWGTLAIYDHYRRRVRPSPFGATVTVRAGAPIDMSDLRARVGEKGPGAALLRETTARMMTAVRELLEEVRGESAPRGDADADGDTGTVR
jgi:1-acyl-sn-glycerol-3-phosphate acyltransferase